MAWLFLALLAYILFAAVTIADKYLLSRPIPDARVYTFYIGVFGLFAFVLAPFGFQIPAGLFIFLSIFAGILFVGALFLFFTALRMGEVSRVGISLGGLVPFFTLLFVYVGAEGGDVIDALVGLGYTRSQAQTALREVPEDMEGVENKVKEALKILGK